MLDCLEFDDALRRGDVLADVAFLAMDLERLGRPDLADYFLTAYSEVAEDSWPASLAHHYIAYRAQVRATVTAIRAAQGHEPSAAEAARLLALARRHLEAGRVQVVVVGGLPGTGKSTLAAGLAEALGAVVLRSDEIRKELAGLPTDRPAPAPLRTGLYGPVSTAAAYHELLHRAQGALGLGETVVLDASWTDELLRTDARHLAADSHSDLVELRCVAPRDFAVARMQARIEHGGDPSDADASIAAAMAATDAPWPTSIAIDTVPPTDEVLATALALVRGAHRRSKR